MKVPPERLRFPPIVNVVFPVPELPDTVPPEILKLPPIVVLFKAVPVNLNSLAPPPVAAMVKLPCTFVSNPTWFQLPASVATFIVRLPQPGLPLAGRFMGASVLAHFVITTLLVLPKERNVLPGKSFTTPAPVLPTALWL